MECPNNECEKRITILEESQKHTTETLIRIEAKVDGIDAHIRNGLSTKVTAAATHLKYVWAVMIIIFVAIIGTWVKAEDPSSMEREILRILDRETPAPPVAVSARDGAPVVAADIFAAMNNDSVKKANILLKVPVAMIEGVKTTGRYIAEKPAANTAKTILTGYLATRLVQGELDDDFKDLGEALGVYERDEPEAREPANNGGVTVENSEGVEIRVKDDPDRITVTDSQNVEIRSEPEPE